MMKKTYTILLTFILLMRYCEGQPKYEIPWNYLQCLRDEPSCKVNGCPDGRLYYSDTCKPKAGVCSGIWPEILSASYGKRFPLCYDPSTGCYMLLNAYNQKWTCLDPHVAACAVNFEGIYLEKSDGERTAQCHDIKCRGDYVLKNPYSNDAYYECVKKSNLDKDLCPGDGVWIREPGSYRCQSNTCKLVSRGDSYVCPSDPTTCQSRDLTPTSELNRDGPLEWVCLNPIQEPLPGGYLIIPALLLSFISCICLCCIWIIKKVKAEKVKKALMINPNQDDSYSQSA